MDIFQAYELVIADMEQRMYKMRSSERRLLALFESTQDKTFYEQSCVAGNHLMACEYALSELKDQQRLLVQDSEA